MEVKLNIDDEKQLEFLQEYLRSFYTSSILKWQYLRWDCNSSLYLLKNNEDYIASQGMIPINLIYQNRIIFSAKSETSFLLPEHRGKGLFEKIYDYNILKSEEDNCELFWGFTALSKVWRRKLKFEVEDGLIHETVLQLNFSAALKLPFSKKQSVINKLKQSMKGVVSAFGNKRLPKSMSGYETKELEWDSSSLANIHRLFKVWCENHRDYISIDTDSEYLMWRVVNNPVAKYKLLGVFKNKTLIGYGIVNHARNYSYLVEFIVPEQNDLKESLLSLIKHVKSEKIHSHLAYWASNQNTYSNQVTSILLKLGGKSYQDFTMNFVSKTTRHTSFDTIKVSDYYINGLWTEGFNI